MNDQAKKLRELAQRIREEREKANLIIDPLSTVPERIKFSQNIIPKTIESPLHEEIIKTEKLTPSDPVKHVHVEHYIEPSAENKRQDNNLLSRNPISAQSILDTTANTAEPATTLSTPLTASAAVRESVMDKIAAPVRIIDDEVPVLIQSPTAFSAREMLFGQPASMSFNTRVIAVSSGKGGVGKSNVVANLGIALATRGRSVMILDADLGMANIDVIFGINPKFNLKHLVDGEKNLEEIIITGPHSIKIVPGGSGVPELANLSHHQQQKLLENFINLERNADIMLIDTGAGISNDVISFILAAREALIITTPEPTAITDAYGLIKVLTQRDLDVDIKVVVNMVSSEKEGREIADRIVMAAKQFLNKKVEPLGYILSDPSVYTSVRQQVPFILNYPSSKASRCIGNLAASIDRITADDQRIASRNGFRGFLSRLFEK